MRGRGHDPRKRRQRKADRKRLRDVRIVRHLNAFAEDWFRQIRSGYFDDKPETIGYGVRKLMESRA